MWCTDHSTVQASIVHESKHIPDPDTIQLHGSETNWCLNQEVAEKLETIVHHKFRPVGNRVQKSSRYLGRRSRIIDRLTNVSYVTAH